MAFNPTSSSSTTSAPTVPTTVARGRFGRAVDALSASLAASPAAAPHAASDPASDPVRAAVPSRFQRAPSAPARPPAAPRISAAARKAVRDRLNEVRIDVVLDALGAKGNQDGEANKWKIEGFGNIITKGQSWKNVNTEKKGYGGVHLAYLALGLETDAQAVAWMLERFGEDVPEHLRAAVSENSAPRQFSPPEPDTAAINEVRRYLTADRGLPASLVDAEISLGHIYASHPVDKAHQRPIGHVVNCVFISSLSAELRGTAPDGFKGCCVGSQTDLSGYRITAAKQASERLLGLTEAAIDALSYRALFPGRLTVSTNGAGRFQLQFRMALEAVDAGFGVRAAFDADPPGDLAAQRLFNAFFVRQALSHHLKVDPETIEQWIVGGDIEVLPEKTPHEMFWSDGGWAPQLPVHEPHVQTDAAGHAETVWRPVADGRCAPPTVVVKAAKDLHPKMRRGKLSLPVSAAAYNYVVHTLNIRRDRPIHVKDWNEQLKRLGTGFLRHYDRCDRLGFAQIPVLPPELERFRLPPPHAGAQVEPGATTTSTSSRAMGFGRR